MVEPHIKNTSSPRWSASKSFNIAVGSLSAFLSLIGFIYLVMLAYTTWIYKPTEAFGYALRSLTLPMTITLTTMFLVKLILDVFFVYDVTTDRGKIINCCYTGWVTLFVLMVLLSLIELLFIFQPYVVSVQVFYVCINLALVFSFRHKEAQLDVPASEQLV